ncbi:MAG TPA: hypothetical protein V6C52_06415 [Coleofasciculaceae cyanobacterium]|jgi:Flp pilus assembly pilin Flp
MNIRQPGGALTEYGLVLSLAVFLAVAALLMLGNSVSDVFQGNSSGLGGSQAQQLVSLKFNQSNIPPGKGKLAVDPATGLPLMQLTDNAVGGVNTTSAEGSIATATETMSLANQLSSAVPNITDPATRSWASEITKLAYYLGGTEGSFAGISTLSVNPTSGMGPKTEYTQAAALSDVYTYQNELLTALQNPPSGANPAEVKMIASLGADAWNNAQGYVTQLSPYLNKNGDLDAKALQKSPLNGDSKKLSNLSYDQIVAYDTLQSQVNQVLADGSASGTPTVQSTLQNATAMTQTTAP